MRKPKPAQKKIRPATERMEPGALGELAGEAVYVGSGHHKDVPAMGLNPAPRKGALHIEDAQAQGIVNPDCSLCPRRWARRQDDATDLLRRGIQLGQVSDDAAPGVLPKRVWVRDPEEEGIVYEARRLTYPDTGYKAYPLTARQSENLSLTVG